jgi:rod shape-determining protein MreC
MQILKNREDILESQRLRALLSLRDSGIGRTVVARVIGRDPARNQTVTIDKGTAHGLTRDSAILTPAGVVGRVIHPSNFFSVVQLILDDQSAVGIMLESSRRQGIVKGTGSAMLELDYIDDDNDLKEGDVLLTSGLDRVYPKGLPVGVIQSIGARRGLLKAVAIRPSADLGRLEEVICVIDRPRLPDPADPMPGPAIP